jgi:nucleotide-sensitive chloride channel 1A
MHAVSTDAGSFARPCVYLQLDEGADGDGDGGAITGLGAHAAAAAGGGGSEDEEDDEEEEQDEGLGAEVRLVPADAAAVEEIFKAMCDCSALNPDSGSEGGFGGGV